MTNALDNVMNEAETAANDIVPAERQRPVPMNDEPANNNTRQLAKPSMDDFLDAGGMDVDEYFKLKAEGFRLGGDMQGLLEELTVEIDMTEVAPMYSARFESNGNTTFIKSYDGQSTPDGKPFEAEVTRLEAANQKSTGVYPSAEIPVTLLEDVADPKKGSSLVIDSGTRVGYTPSVTGFKCWQKFGKALRRQDPSLLEATLKVKITHRKRVNSNNNEWGVLDFEMVERLD